MDNKKQEKEHASTLARIAKQEAAEAAKMKCGGKGVSALRKNGAPEHNEAVAFC